MLTPAPPASYSIVRITRNACNMIPVRAGVAVEDPRRRHVNREDGSWRRWKRTLDRPVRAFERGRVEVVTLGGVTFGRATFQPGWRWSTHVKPVARTESCEAPHLQYHVSGRLRVRMDDGSEDEFGPGDVSLLPSGHDAWVVGDEPVVVIDISGMTNYAKPA